MSCIYGSQFDKKKPDHATVFNQTKVREREPLCGAWDKHQCVTTSE